MVRMDVTSLQFPDGTFDAVVCNHVLEHVEDDRKALAEMYRVLKPGGWASIQVPMKGKATVEAAGVLNAYEQLHLFGQEDHVRQYGRDFEDRLREAGFRVEIIQKHDLAGKDLLRRLAVEAEQEVWLTFKDRTS
jgi:ubiquinone/menaquinone biosynthesis C-methylase UbiE